MKKKKLLDIEKKRLALERDNFHKIQEVQTGKIKLNVGGTYFTTSVSSLIREPNSMLARLCTSDFKPSSDDSAYFLDREPELFKSILYYLRMGELDPEIMSQITKQSILKEAQYFMMDKFVNLIEADLKQKRHQKEERDRLEHKQNEEIFTIGSNYKLSKSKKIATKSTQYAAFDANILGNETYSNGVHQWTVKITGTYYMIGIAPFNINRNGTNMHTQCGWYLCNDSTLYSGPPMSYSNKKYTNTDLATGSTVSVKLDIDNKTIAFAINGTDCGVAYNDILTDKELSLCTILCSINDSVQIM